MFRIARFASQIVAEQAAIYLREHGIDACVVGDLASQVALTYSAMKLGQHEVILLDSSQRADAELVLQSFHEEPIELEEGWEAEAEIDVSGVDFSRFPIHCEACGNDVSTFVRESVCLHCRNHFDAAALLLAQHGPEAFTGE